MKRLLIGLCLVAGGAAAQGQDVLQAVGSRFQGQEVVAMFARYGAPLRQTQAGDMTIYTWETADTLYFGRQPPLMVRCQLDAYVSGTTVRTVGISGQRGACERFMP